jgi:predicted O-linked N-acetylglucosamine transferase (SPINDLY family)
LAAETEELLAMVRAEKPLSLPYAIVAIPSSPAEQLQCAKRYVQDQPAHPPLWQGEAYAHDRFRVAYLSADFNEHPTAYLTAGLFEQHDRSRFEITALSFGQNDNSPARRRLEAAFEHFIDVGGNSDQEIAELMRRSEIDIAVDLMGFTQDHRLGVLARRAAPIQVNYLGYPGTTGAPYMDYILADATVIPEDHDAFYAERVVRIPGTYQINDNRRAIGQRTPTRGECGLPQNAFVFCCFNNPQKITPEIFDIWMRLLQATEGSVLWLITGIAKAAANLRLEAEKRGVAPERLIFAPKASVADHLARHRLADLCLDTLPYNAHTTASDALWAGLPVLTCLGETFAGRVAASLLKAIGLDALITRTLGEYEALALRLARDPAYLVTLKDRLIRNRDGSLLFDTQRATRHIETAYRTMAEIARRSEKPRSFNVE